MTEFDMMEAAKRLAEVIKRKHPYQIDAALLEWKKRSISLILAGRPHDGSDAMAIMELATNILYNRSQKTANVRVGDNFWGK